MFYNGFSRGGLALVGDVLDAILWRICSRGRASLRMSYRICVCWNLWVHVRTGPGSARVC